MKIHSFDVTIYFEPRDLWVGLYWNLTRGSGANELNVYVCLLPCLPIRLRWWWWA